MASYRFYYLNDCDHIIDAAWAPCPGDAAATARARAMLAEAPDCRAIEVWNGTRRIETIALATTGSC